MVEVWAEPFEAWSNYVESAAFLFDREVHATVPVYLTKITLRKTKTKSDVDSPTATVGISYNE